MIMKKSNAFLIEKFYIDPKLQKLADACEYELSDKFSELEEIKKYNQFKILSAFNKNRISDSHFAWNTGYGYDDPGREAVERVYSDVFNTEDSLVRTNIVNGTHAIAITLLGLLKRGDKLIYATGKPYDTMDEVIGIRGENRDSLLENGIEYKHIDLTKDGKIDLEELKRSITSDVKMISFQRSMGYGWRPAFSPKEIGEACRLIHSIRKDIICMVDNCYGEFTNECEPTDFGADVIAGSLIKNPGGGLALSGGYICGKRELIDRISYRLTSPGVGSECGLTFGQTRSVLQGIFISPQVVNSALKGAIFCSKMFENLGFKVLPESDSERNDIIQAIRLGDPKKIEAFCKGIQNASPVESFITPVPWKMPGYDTDVIMAAGGFVQGSSIELSCDAPMRNPYIAYFQGGLTYEHSYFGVIKGIDALIKQGLIKL